MAGIREISKDLRAHHLGNGVIKPVHLEAGVSVLHVKAPGQMPVVKRAVVKGRNEVANEPKGIHMEKLH